MPNVLPRLPEPSAGAEDGPYCVIVRHRALPGRADVYEKRMLADLEQSRAEPERFSSIFTVTTSTGMYSSSTRCGGTWWYNG